MADLQKQFEKFHEAIKLKRFDENRLLIEKREIVLSELRDGLDRLFEEKNEPAPTFDWFNQGSYAMDVGIKPLNDGDFDIDVGLRFHVSCDDYEDPYEVKSWVFDSLEGHTSDVSVERCCIRVNYVGEYHVDLAVYASSECNNGHDYLAKGFKGSSDEYKVWERSDVRRFVSMIQDHRSGDEGRQFRRVIRYLKRWKDFQFSSIGHAAPVGIGITICAYNDFTPRFDHKFSGKTPKDLLAMKELVGRMIQGFQRCYHEPEEEWGDRLQAMMPVAPWDDVFDPMSNKQMDTFREKLHSLHDALWKAHKEVDPHHAAKIIEEQFGNDFPVPAPEDDAKKASQSAFITHSSSA